MTTFAIVRISQVIHHQREAETSEFPARAVAFLQQHPPAGPIFNLYDWGGYLIWKLYPTTPVFIDGRADLYGADLFHDFADVYQFKGRWQQILHRWHIQTVIVPPTSALGRRPAERPRLDRLLRRFPSHRPDKSPQHCYCPSEDDECGDSRPRLSIERSSIPAASHRLLSVCN